jgi:uroporphyrinogen decarboxylase
MKIARSKLCWNRLQIEGGGYLAEQPLSHKDRLVACLQGGPSDRAPVALWRHFPVDDQTPAGLVAAILNFQQIYDFDLVKVTPASSFCIKDWGVEDEWCGNPEGTRDYTRAVIHQPQDWEHLPQLEPTKGHLADQIDCLRELAKQLGPETPIIQTIFNPLSQAKNLAGRDLLLVHLRRYPEAVLTGLKTIAESTRRFLEATLPTGIAGVFYAVQHAQYGLLSEQEYAIYGREYDLQVLKPAQDLWLNVLHLHGSEVMFNSFLEYPVQVINWHDRDAPPSLGEALKSYKGAVCGGIRRETMALGNPQMVRDEARQALEATGGRRFILGTGCVVDIIAPYGNLMAARQVVEE